MYAPAMCILNICTYMYLFIYSNQKIASSLQIILFAHFNANKALEYMYMYAHFPVRVSPRPAFQAV
jgi:hypothetical protein